MDGIQLRDEAVRDRIRAAEEFLDPSMVFCPFCCNALTLCRRQSSTKLQIRHHFDAAEVSEETHGQHR